MEADDRALSVVCGHGVQRRSALTQTKPPRSVDSLKRIVRKQKEPAQLPGSFCDYVARLTDAQIRMGIST
jgi:hypothetical protein